MITINKKKCNSDKDCDNSMLCAFNDEDLNSYCIDNDLTHLYAGCLNKNDNFETTISKIDDNMDHNHCINFARRQINKDGIEYNYMIYRPKKKVFVDTTNINIYLKCGEAVLAVLPYDDYFNLTCDENQENCILKGKSSLINFIRSNSQNCIKNIYLEVIYECENEGIKKTERIPIDLNIKDINININLKCPVNTNNDKYKSKCEALFIDDYNNSNLNNSIDIEKTLYDCNNPLYRVPRLVSNINNHRKLKTKYSTNEIKNYDNKINEKLEDLKKLEAEKYIKLKKIQTGQIITMEEAMDIINKNYSNNNGVIKNSINNNWKIYKNYDAAQNLFNYDQNEVKILNYFGKVYTIQDAIDASNKNYQNFFVWYHNSFELSDYASKLFFIDIYSSDENILNKNNWVKNDNVTTGILKLQFEHFNDNDKDDDYMEYDDINNISDDSNDIGKLKEIFDTSSKNTILQEDIEEVLNNYIKYEDKLSDNIINNLNDKITTYGQAILLNNYETDINNKILMYLSIGMFFIFIILVIVTAYFNNKSAGKIKLFGR